MNLQRKTNTLRLKNRRARFDYDLLDEYIAGLVLTGTEIKSIRQAKVSLNNSFCDFNKTGELFVVNMIIEPYDHAKHFNHNPKRKRKLLLQKQELKKLGKAVTTTGLSVVPVVLFINQQGFAKMTIALARGKKKYDKRADIKEKDVKRHLAKLRKYRNR